MLACEMSASIRLGRLGGIPVSASWTLAPVLALIAAGLAGSLLPAAAPGAQAWGYWLFGVFAALAFYGCLLVHELAHARAGARHRLRVKQIVLWAAGGLAELEREPASPREEIELAAAGPLASLGLSAALALLAALVAALGSAALLPVTLNWLAAMNALLAIFNLLPAFPLDGGRILRALLWRRRQDRVAATLTAARLGQGAGLALGALGAAAALSGLSLLGGVWLIVIGWLLYTAAAQERRSARPAKPAVAPSTAPAAASRPTPAIPSGTVSTPPSSAARTPAVPPRAADAMSATAPAVAASTPIAEVIGRHVLASGATAVPVMDRDGRLLGLATVERIAALDRQRWASTPIAAATAPMSAIATCTPDEPLQVVLARLAVCPEDSALVLDDGRPAGVLCARRARQFLDGS
jgi:Zn-dependent protease